MPIKTHLLRLSIWLEKEKFKLQGAQNFSSIASILRKTCPMVHLITEEELMLKVLRA